MAGARLPYKQAFRYIKAAPIARQSTVIAAPEARSALSAKKGALAGEIGHNDKPRHWAGVLEKVVAGARNT